MNNAETQDYEDIEITITAPDGKEKFYPLVSFTRHFTPVVDGNYGADADGNRGTRAEWVEDDHATDISICGIPFSAFSEDWQDAIKAGLNDWLENNYPDLVG